ncbi:MAG: hypothetical protein IKL51_07590 [Lachnospiraceae bacterium]|mgnify:CR=1 FL=1|nr:hypothetical protein [Lachnospiraceae bacterium]
MRVTEKLLLRNNQQKNKKKHEDEWEETMTYDTRQRNQALNDRKRDSFFSSMNEGINTRKNIFDRKAIFHTNTKGNKE